MAPTRRRAAPAGLLRYRERVVLLELGMNYSTQELRLEHHYDSLRGHVSDAPTLECPFVTVAWDDGTVATLHAGNVRRVSEREV